MAEITHPIFNLSKDELLFQLLNKQHGYYKAIYQLTREEGDHLRDPLSPKEVKAYLKKKKELLSLINEVDTALIPLRRYWHSKKDKNDFVSEQIMKELEAMNALLTEILKLDLLNQKMMRSIK